MFSIAERMLTFEGILSLILLAIGRISIRTRFTKTVDKISPPSDHNDIYGQRQESHYNGGLTSVGTNFISVFSLLKVDAYAD
jgi:hypothetical protein